MTAKASISLTDEKQAFARGLVESGQYASLSAVLQRGLDMLRHESELRAAELEALTTLIDERRTGAFIDLDAGEAETKSMLTRKRQARATLAEPQRQCTSETLNRTSNVGWVSEALPIACGGAICDG